jgi:hypothetical protein
MHFVFVVSSIFLDTCAVLYGSCCSQHVFAALNLQVEIQYILMHFVFVVNYLKNVQYLLLL